MLESIKKYAILGVPTDILYLETTCSRRSSDTLSRTLSFFFVCGNPGPIEFYVAFLRQLLLSISSEYNLHYEKVIIYGISQANHHLRDDNDNNTNERTKNYGLEFQIQHKLDFVDQIIDECNKKGELDRLDIVMVGHSIGAYMIATMLARNSVLHRLTTNMIMLMPFIRWPGIPLIHRMRLSLYKVLHPISHWSVATIILALSHLPVDFRRLLISSSTGFSGELLHIITNRLFTPRLVNNFLAMGKDEIEAIPRDESKLLEFLKQIVHKKTDSNPPTTGTTPIIVSTNETFEEPQDSSNYKPSTLSLSDTEKTTDFGGLRAPRLMLLYTDNDMWAPEGDIQKLSQCIPECDIVFIPGLTHAFTLLDWNESHTDATVASVDTANNTTSTTSSHNSNTGPSIGLSYTSTSTSTRNDSIDDFQPLIDGNMVQWRDMDGILKWRDCSKDRKATHGTRKICRAIRAHISGEDMTSLFDGQDHIENGELMFTGTFEDQRNSFSARWPKGNRKDFIQSRL